MSANLIIDKQEDNFSTQTKRNGTLSTTTPDRPSPSTRRFQEITKQIISTPTRRSSTGMHHNAPNLPSSEAIRSSNSGKVRRYSLSNVVACATNPHYPARLSADDGNHRYSHQGASSSVTSHGSSHSISSNSKVKYGSRLPSSSRISHTNILHHGSSLPTPSSDQVHHRSSNPTISSRNKGDDTDSENPRSGLSNGACGGDEQTHFQGCITEPSFLNLKSNSAGYMIAPSNVGSTSDCGSQGKLASRNRANTSSKLSESRAVAPKGIARVAETYKKSQAGLIRDSAPKHRTNELCKDCKASIMESVCFIANDGRISAAITGAAYARHSHHCNVRGCAANRSYYQSPSPLLKKDSLSKREVPLNLQRTRRKSHTLSGIGDRGSTSTASSVQGDDCSKREMELSARGSVDMSSSTGSGTHDMKQELNLEETCYKSKCFEGDESHVNTDSDSLCQTAIDQNSLDEFSPCKDRSQSPSTQVPKDQQSYGENSHVENVTPAASCISSEIHDDDDEKGSVSRDDIQALNDFKSLFYHGDNEYSCSEDGTEATMTPNSLIKGAFDDLSNIDIEQSSCENELSRSRRLTMARMRQKYLESLREQEAETVRLRKQEIMARKQAGDWMLDCHMEEVLHRLAPNGEARVKVLVEAFETVINHSDSDSSQTAHHQDQDHLENQHSYASS